MSRLPDWMLLLVFCLAFSFQVILAAVQKSATFDEPANLASGYVEVTLGDYWLLPENLPFVKQLAALPLLFMDVKTPPPPHPDNDGRLYGWRFLYESNDGDRLLLLGRLAVLPLALLLGCCVYLWTKHLFGKAAALFALFLFTFDPNLLAHAGLVTTDLAVTCLMFVAVYGLYRLTREISLPGLLLPGVALGLSLLTKFTLYTLLLILLLLAVAASLDPQPIHLRLPGRSPREISGRGRKAGTLLVVLVAAGLVAYGLMWAAYRFRSEAFVAGGVASPRVLAHVLPVQPFLGKAFLWAGEARLLPEAYLYGFSLLLRKSGDFPAFLMGKIQAGGWWYYFLATFLIKTPVAFLLLLAVGLGGHGRRWREDPVRSAFLLGPVLVYFVLISVSGWNIGHRHLLPIYPFLFVWVGALVPWVRQFTGSGRWVQGALAALALWYAGGTIAIAPHYLAYFNELVGGPDQGYKYLVDSNLDWGQDLKGLKRYMDAHGIDRLWLSYFGSASPDYYGIRYNYLPSYKILKPNRDQVSSPFVAVSATNLQGVYLEALGLDQDFYKQFRERQPVAKIGYSIFIYRVQ